ncbi:hypothetical protein LEN26_001978 [Aphanomyces euteiches]|nr:hypothetical protein AeMF1_012962 [Aphanomyces euteiches]KAH9160195.1 hypothetical protein LEN26_001978 [Aphanomyces euteiches]KAH9186858.1 hypothetical protein AeNC1_011162 [Aphanomyces euteiches]
MKGYMWENNDLRQQIVTCALEKPTLERFVMEEINASKWKILGKFNRRKKLALLEFSGPRDGGYEGLDLDKLRGFIKGFRPILVDDIETLYILGIKYVGHCNIWPTLAPLLKQSKVKILIMECGKMEGTEANEVAEVLCHLPALQKLDLQSKVPFETLMLFINVVSPTVKQIPIAYSATHFAELYSPTECEALQEQALKRSISLFNSRR